MFVKGIGAALLVFAWLQAQGDDTEVITFNSNGGWSWFEDERAIIHNGQLIVGSVANYAGDDGGRRGGNVEVVVYDLAGGDRTLSVLERYTGGNDDDDHNSPVFLPLPGGRILTAYARHNVDNYMHWARSSSGNASQWSDANTLDVGGSATYANLFRLSGEDGLIYNFHRGRGFNPNFMISRNNGVSWEYGGRLMTGPGRPYLKYASNNENRIHFINTEQHPRDYNNSIYHGYLQEGKILNSRGSVLDDSLFDEEGISPTAPTLVYRGDANNVVWTSDIHLDTAGHPYVAFSVQKNSAGLSVGQGGEDHRYFYGRWDGSQWRVHEMAYAGSRLYSGEDDYTGNIALDPDNPNIVYISADVDPESGEPLISSSDNNRHYEIFRGITSDSGATWQWIPLTQNSNLDNIRPVVPGWSANRTAVLWMRGTYTSYTQYNTAIVGMIRESEPVGIQLNHKNGKSAKRYTFHINGQSELFHYFATDAPQVAIFDILGDLIAESQFSNGKAEWDGRTLNGQQAPGGIYFIQFKNGHGTQVYRIVKAD